MFKSILQVFPKIIYAENVKNISGYCLVLPFILDYALIAHDLQGGRYIWLDSFAVNLNESYLSVTGAFFHR